MFAGALATCRAMTRHSQDPVIQERACDVFQGAHECQGIPMRKERVNLRLLQGWWNVTWYFLTSVFSMIFLLDSWLFVNHLHPLKSSVLTRNVSELQVLHKVRPSVNDFVIGLAFGVLPFSAAFLEIQLHFWGGGLEVLVVSLRGFLWWNELWNDI